MIPADLYQHIVMWRVAFRRGDPGQMRASELAIWAHPLAASAAALPDIEAAMWDDKDGEILLQPAPKASLLAAIHKGWRYQLYGVPVGVQNGGIVINFDAILFAPDGTIFEGSGVDRHLAIKAALNSAGIPF